MTCRSRDIERHIENVCPPHSLYVSLCSNIIVIDFTAADPLSNIIVRSINGCYTYRFCSLKNCPKHYPISDKKVKNVLTFMACLIVLAQGIYLHLMCVTYLMMLNLKVNSQYHILINLLKRHTSINFIVPKIGREVVIKFVHH